MPESIMIGGRICNMSDSRNDHLDGARGSISIHFVHDALAGARRQGVDTAPLLAAAGIPPERLEAARARVSPRQYATLWRALADRMDDEFFGLDSHPMRRGSFRLMCHSVLTSRNLEQAMRRAMQVLPWCWTIPVPNSCASRTAPRWSFTTATRRSRCSLTAPC